MVSCTPVRHIPGNIFSRWCRYIFVSRMGAVAELSGVAGQAIPFLLGCLFWIFSTAVFACWVPSCFALTCTPRLSPCREYRRSRLGPDCCRASQREPCSGQHTHGTSRLCHRELRRVPGRSALLVGDAAAGRLSRVIQNGIPLLDESRGARAPHHVTSGLPQTMATCRDRRSGTAWLGPGRPRLPGEPATRPPDGE